MTTPFEYLKDSKCENHAYHNNITIVWKKEITQKCQIQEVYTVRGNVNYLDFSFMTRLVDNKRQLELSYRNGVAEMWDGWPT